MMYFTIEEKPYYHINTTLCEDMDLIYEMREEPKTHQIINVIDGDIK